MIFRYSAAMSPSREAFFTPADTFHPRPHLRSSIQPDQFRPLTLYPLSSHLEFQCWITTVRRRNTVGQRRSTYDTMHSNNAGTGPGYATGPMGKGRMRRDSPERDQSPCSSPPSPFPSLSLSLSPKTLDLDRTLLLRT